MGYLVHDAAGEAADNGVVLVKVLLHALHHVGRAQVVGGQAGDAALWQGRAAQAALDRAPPPQQLRHRRQERAPPPDYLLRRNCSDRAQTPLTV